MHQLSLFDPQPPTLAPPKPRRRQHQRTADAAEHWERDPAFPQFDRRVLGSGPLVPEEIAALGIGGWVLVSQGDEIATFALNGSEETYTADGWRDNIDILLIGARKGV